MSVKTTLTTSPTPPRRLPEPTPTAPVVRAEQAVKNTVQGVAQRVDQGVNRNMDSFGARLPDLPGLGELKGLPLEALKNLDLDKLRKALSVVFPPRTHHDGAQRLLQQTQDFRHTLGQVRQLSEALRTTPASSPRRAELQKAFDAAEGQLQSRYGYTNGSAPRPGALWVDPKFNAKELPGGKRSASQFPTGRPVTQPPQPLDFLFGQGTSPLQLGEGASARTVSNPEQYRAAVAARRAELGMPVKDGEPIGVHLSLQGGGGKGKRYGAMLAEMYDVGVVPTSLSGTSAGSIAAAFAATGAGPEAVQAVAKDPRLAKLYDLDLDPKDGGLLNGQKAYDLFDQKLRELTGIKDRPVTFADLKVPLQLFAAKMYDSDAGPKSGTTVAERTFVFSQETTPDTPVALAMRASMAIPGVFEPVQMVDPVTGREVHLIDGGTLDNLPMDSQHGSLPTIGASLATRGGGHPDDHPDTGKPLPAGNLDATNLLWNALNGYTLLKDSGADHEDYWDKTHPDAHEFMLAVPTWDLNDPSKKDSMLEFGYDPKVDPALDQQDRKSTRLNSSHSGESRMPSSA